jgi:hypothetical protein
MTETVRLADYGLFFATRAKARDIIATRIEALPAGEPLVLDWSGVEAVTGAFASELAAWFLRNNRKVIAEGMSDEIRETWETAVRRLAEPVPESPELALMRRELHGTNPDSPVRWLRHVKSALVKPLDLFRFF